MSLLRHDLRAIVGGAFGDIFLDGELTQTTTAYNSADELVSTPTPYPAKMIEDTYSDMARAQGVPTDQRKFILLAEGLPVEPNTDDTLTFEGQTLAIVSVERDPAGATWTLGTR